MLNKLMLKERYKDLVLEDREKFLAELNFIKEKINLHNLSRQPLLIYSQNKRNALYYILSVFYSLKADRILDYTVVTGQTLINQHFATEKERDADIYTGIYYDDITYISLSQYDYTSEYLESLIIDLIEFRRQNKKLTIISYDVMSSGSQYVSMTKKLHSYFLSSQFQIVDISKTGKTPFDKVSKEAVENPPKQNPTKPTHKPTKIGKRIV